MIKIIGLVGLMLFAVAGVGCKTTDVSDGDLANEVYTVSKSTSSLVATLIFNKNPDKVVALKANAAVVSSTIRTHVVLVFSGGTSGDLLKSSVDAALVLLSTKLDPLLVDVVKLAMDLAADRIDLPQNPAEKLSDRTRMALLAFFNGVADGLDAAATAVVPTQSSGSNQLNPHGIYEIIRWPNR
jgi:hypothetical protein